MQAGRLAVNVGSRCATLCFDASCRPVLNPNESYGVVVGEHVDACQPCNGNRTSLSCNHSLCVCQDGSGGLSDL
jgi:hypothetical protein